MKAFQLQIITPKGIYRDVEIEIVNLRTGSGQLGILANHIPFVSGIEISEMNYKKDGKREQFAIAGGFVYVNEEQTTIIANAIEAKDEIDIQRAIESKEKAERLLASGSKDIDILRAEVALQRAISRIRVKNI